MATVASALRSRLAEFRELLSSDIIDLKRLRQLCFQGCPEDEGIRATCWKILLDYLPSDTREWDTMLRKQRALYQQLVDEVIANPNSSESSTAEGMIDHPLNPDPKSHWKQFFIDNDVLLQIDNDTRRLYPDMSFFQLPTPYPRSRHKASAVFGIEALRKRIDRSVLPSQKVATSSRGILNVSMVSKTSREPYSPLKEEEEAHWEVVERILFIHAKMNRGIGYVQGMNEIIGPLYFVFAQHPDTKWKEHAEADTFFCFTTLMAEIGDNFTKTLDLSRAGIGGAMHKMMKLLRAKDPTLHKHLVTTEVDPTFFGFRWITVLLSQEFLLPDVIRIWDSFFADEKRFDFVIHFCCAMLICIRSELMKGDFTRCMKLLQNYPEGYDIQKLLHKAHDIQRFHPLS